MRHLKKIYIPYQILHESTASLRTYGARKCEGLVLWLGHINEDNTGRVKRVLVPPQNPIESEDGVGYFVTAQTLFNINKLLSTTGLRLLAQVHSHPGRAYHSAADDRYCIVTQEGGFSMVVPNFGFGPSDLSRWATYRLINGLWEKLSTRTVQSLFYVEGKPEGNHCGNTTFSKWI